MRYLYTLLIIVFLSPAQKAFAVYDSVAVGNCLHISVMEQPVLLQDPCATHLSIDGPYRHYDYRTRRDPARASTGLLVGGIICTVAGTLLMVRGYLDEDPNGKYNALPYLELGAGALVGTAGLTMTIIGGVIKIRSARD